MKGVDEPVCCNCGGRHPANYQGCPKIKLHAKTKANTMKSNVVQPNKPIPVRRTPQVKRKLSFNSVVKMSSNTNVQGGRSAGMSEALSGLGQSCRSAAIVSTNNNLGSGVGTSQGGFSFIMGEIDSLFGTLYENLLGIISEFLPIYRQCNNNAQKRILLVEFLIRVSP